MKGPLQSSRNVWQRRSQILASECLRFCIIKHLVTQIFRICSYFAFCSMCLKLFCLGDPWCSEWGCCKGNSDMDCGRCSPCSHAHCSKVDYFLEKKSFVLIIMISHPGKYEYCSADPTKYSCCSSVKPIVSKASWATNAVITSKFKSFFMHESQNPHTAKTDVTNWHGNTLSLVNDYIIGYFLHQWTYKWLECEEWTINLVTKRFKW